MESDVKRVPASNKASIVDGTALLCNFIENNADLLLRTLRGFAGRAGLTESDVAKELLNEVLIEALEHAERFDSSRRPMAWLLGIAANLIHRKKSQIARRNRHEVLARDYRSNDEALSEEMILERLAGCSAESAADEIESDSEASHMLGLVSEDDQTVLRLAILEGMNGKSLAQALGTRPSTARVRLFRAISRLREAWIKQQGDQGGKR